jgi:hypothetical protein
MPEFDPENANDIDPTAVGGWPPVHGALKAGPVVW